MCAARKNFRINLPIHHGHFITVTNIRNITTMLSLAVVTMDRRVGRAGGAFSITAVREREWWSLLRFSHFHSFQITTPRRKDCHSQCDCPKNCNHQKLPQSLCNSCHCPCAITLDPPPYKLPAFQHPSSFAFPPSLCVFVYFPPPPLHFRHCACHPALLCYYMHVTIHTYIYIHCGDFTTSESRTVGEYYKFPARNRSFFSFYISQSSTL